MRAVQEGLIPLLSPTGEVIARLRVAALPRRGATVLATLWSSAVEGQAGPVELLEGMEYRYAWEDIESGAEGLMADPEELFQPDTEAGLAGRLRPGLATGTIRIKLRSGNGPIGQLECDVRSRKLTYQAEYRWMLRDIAEHLTELVLDRFSVSNAQFELDDTRDTVTLYQRFTFLRALFESEVFQGALNEIIRRPHTAWENMTETVRGGAGIRADSHVLRQFAKAGARSAWPDGPLASVPAHFERRHTEATHDTAPNRFVKFALEHWLQMLGDIERALAATPSVPASARGRREIETVAARLAEALHQDMFASVGPLTRFPAEDQVLQKREGYRDIFKAYVETEFAARLSWQPSDDSYAAGQRDIATLYEYWAFIQLSRVVGDLIGHSFDMAPLVQTRTEGLTVGIRTGVETVLSGIVERFDQRMHVELCFNRTFRRSRTGEFSSWTTPMRPDYSLIIRPVDNEAIGYQPILLHFDAKYRVEFVREIVGQGQGNESDGDAVAALERGGVVRDDLLKMHAYRDAIHNTAGAYVLYPGGDSEAFESQYRKSDHLIPGLGAFVLRPTDNGNASGATTIGRFISDALDHVAMDCLASRGNS